MNFCSRQNGGASPTSLLAELQGVAELSGLLLPAEPDRRIAPTLARGDGIGLQGKWLVEAMRQLRTLLFVDPELTISTTLGVEPWRRAVEELSDLLVEAQLENLLVGRVVGDDLLDRIELLLRSGIPLRHTQSGDEFGQLSHPILSARVPLGAAAYVQAESAGARLIVGGVAAAGALGMGMIYPHLTIDGNDWNALASAALHAVAVEKCSLELEVLEQQPLRLRPRGADRQETVEQLVRKGLEQIASPHASRRAPLADVSADWSQLEFQWDAHGGVSLKGVAGGPPPAELPVDIVYALGVTARLEAPLLSSKSHHRAAELAEQVACKYPLTTGPFSRQGARTTLQQGGPDDPERVSLVLDLYNRDEAAVSHMYREVRELLARQGHVAIDSPLLPEISTFYQHWPTTIPRVAVDWDVEIRAAKDWA